jgi:NAD(P)-dependent dehydrogenase (short-subunit alcohol dehydrogenase family)
VTALVPILANELKPLRVNAVSPGVIETPWWDFLPNEQKGSVFADYASKTPVGRVGRVEDVAQSIVFLVCDTFMSGHTIVCDGGLSLILRKLASYPRQNSLALAVREFGCATFGIRRSAIVSRRG